MRAPQNPQGGAIPPRAGSPAAQPQIVETPKGETAQVLSSAPVQRIDAEDVGARDGMVAGSAVDPDATPPREPPPEVERYVVVKEAIFTDRGHRVRLPVGKVIDSLNYDVRHIIRQGVRVHRLRPDEDPAEALERILDRLGGSA